MELEHESTSKNPLLSSYENAEQYLSHDNIHALFETSESNLNFFDGAENREEMNLDFLINDFGTDSWASIKNKENITSTPLPLEVPMANSNRPSSPLPSLPSMAPPENQEPSEPQTQTISRPGTQKIASAPEATATSANDSNGNGDEKDNHQHLSTLLEITLRLHLKTPSITQFPISEALRLARQGLQAVQQCLPTSTVPPPAPSSSESSQSSGSPTHLGSVDTESEASSILACILLMDRVLLSYESLLKRRSRLDTPSPAPSSNSISNPTDSSSTNLHSMQPIFIGDFEVQGKASWKVILDAVVRAEMQEARNAVSKLEDWADNLIGRGKNEGHLAVSFLEPLRQRFHD